MNFYTQYKFLIVPFVLWFCIQAFKVIWDLVTIKQFNFKRIVGAGGMPSAHSGVVVVVATMIGKSEGISSPLFALAFFFAFVVMYDACGVRRAAGKQAHILNEIVNTKGLTTLQVNEKLEELLGHTPTQVLVGALIGLIAGLIA